MPDFDARIDEVEGQAAMVDQSGLPRLHGPAVHEPVSYLVLDRGEQESDRWLRLQSNVAGIEGIAASGTYH
jgi:hypothetical protein